MNPPYLSSRRVAYIFIRIVLLYGLGLARAAVFVPVVFSWALFLILIPLMFQDGLQNFLFFFVPDGSYDFKDILHLYGKFAFGIAIIVSFTEIVLKKKIALSLKRQMLVLLYTTTFGYFLTFVFLVFKADFTVKDSLIIVSFFYIFALMGIAFTGLISALMSFVDKVYYSPLVVEK